MSTLSVDDPLASSSEQFGLSRPRQGSLCRELPSPPEVRPWGLRGMRRGALTGTPAPEFAYCHDQQVAVDDDGRPLILTGMVDPSTASITDGDGDEGRSEDWTYDFVPDNPDQA